VRNKKGFTLIELMIVIAIIAILAAILVPNFLKARAQGQLAACESNLKNIATALEMYATDFSGDYPAGALTLLTSTATGGAYMKAIPNCPSVTTAPYDYTSNASPDNFTLTCGAATAHIATGTVCTTANWPQYTPGEGIKLK
jgi:type IV pilus assembly protein PilA